MASGSSTNVHDIYDNLDPGLKTDLNVGVVECAKDKDLVDSTEAGKDIIKGPLGKRLRIAKPQFSGVFGVAVRRALKSSEWQEDMGAPSVGNGRIYKRRGT